MVKFELRKPIETKASKIEVDPDLLPGVYTFSLVVVDEQGNESHPDLLTVQIRPARPGRPERPEPPGRGLGRIVR
jgi:hypothetical protein